VATRLVFRRGCGWGSVCAPFHIKYTPNRVENGGFPALHVSGVFLLALNREFHNAFGIESLALLPNPYDWIETSLADERFEIPSFRATAAEY